MSQRYEMAVIGAGLTGASIAFGMRGLGRRLAIFDEGDDAHRASYANFGLIWVQGKGRGCAPYASWTQQSAREWPALASSLFYETGIDVALAQRGGLSLCLSQRELDARAAHLRAVLDQPGFERYRVQVLDHAGVAARLPAVGPDVVGGTWSDLDGHCDPLKLLHALHVALAHAHCVYWPRHAVSRIEPRSSGFALVTANGTFETERVVVAAGLACAALASKLGVDVDVHPNKGHLLALERVPSFLDVPIETIRQTAEGTVLIGDSQQARSADDTLDIPVLAAMAERATRVFPHLRDARVVRSWTGLRVMTPDGVPIYAQSSTHAGAFVVACHSGVTLAAAHAHVLAPAIGQGHLPEACAPFSMSRFDVPQAA